MKKKRIIIASILGATSLIAGAAATTILITDNFNNKIQEKEIGSLDESVVAEDDIFGNGIMSLIADKPVKRTENNTQSQLVKPMIGRQYYINDGKISIRFFAAISELDVNAVWTRTLYNADGSVNNALSTSTKTSTVAYTSLSYYDHTNGENAILNATDVKAEDGTNPYKYFVIYTIKNIPISDYENCSIDANLEISNDNGVIASKTGSVKTNTTAAMSSYTLDLDFDNTYPGEGTAAGNQSYINGKVKTIYSENESFSSDNLVVLLKGNKVDNPNITGFSNDLGKHSIVVSTANASATYDVYVLATDSAYQDAKNNYVVTVDQSYAGTIGAVDGDNGNMFTTISQALEFLQNSEFVPTNAKKILNISAGYYFEKLEITTPNLTIKGAGTIAKGTYSSDENYNAADYAASTIIEYDTLYGVVDTNGFTHTTDSTQTVAVRDSAVNCQIEGIVISNKWNCKEYFDLNNISNEHRALALLVQSDRFIMKNSALLGYQDTLELFTGRQYFNNCYISGATDFIFGTNNTTMFEECEIHSINSGYVNAFKGCNKGASDYVEYGAIYNNCNFTANSDVASGSVSVARPWDEYSAVAVVNSSIGGHISTSPYAGGTSGTRYVSMNSTPDNANVKFVEYNNNGAGAISESQKGVTILTEEAAANYTNYSVVFGKFNGGLSYSFAWNHKADPVIENNITFKVNGNYNSSNVVDLTEFTSTEVKTDTVGFKGKIKISVKAKSLIEINGYDGYVNFTVDGKNVITNSVFYYENAGTLVIDTGTKTSYIKSIKIYENIESQDEIELKSISVLGQPTTDFVIGDTCDLSSLVVKAYYTDGTYAEVDNYTTNANEVIDSNQTGTYTVTVTFTEGTISKTASFDVAYVAVINNTITETTGFTFKGKNYTGENVKNLNDGSYNTQLVSGTVEKVTFDTDGSNGTNNWLKFNSGNTISLSVSEPCMLNICFYNGNNNSKVELGDEVLSIYATEGSGDKTKYSYAIKTAGDITITSTSNGYIGYFEVVFGATFAIDTNTSLVLANTNTSLVSAVGESGKVEGNKITYDNFVLDATTGKIGLNADNIQFNAGTKILFTVEAGATVQVTGYPGNYAYSINGVEATREVSSITVDTRTDIIVLATGNKYLKQIDISYPTYLNSTVYFGTSNRPNEDEISIQSSKGQVGDIAVDATSGKLSNSGRTDKWAQINSGTSLEFNVAAGSLVSFELYDTNFEYTINGGKAIAVTSTKESFMVLTSSKIILTAKANTYISSVSVKTISIIDSNTTISFGEDGNYNDLSSIAITATISDNGTNNSKITGGNIVFNVKAGANVEIYGNYRVDFTVNSEDPISGLTGELNQSKFNYSFTEDSTVTIVCGSNNYFYSIKITY